MRKINWVLADEINSCRPAFPRKKSHYTWSSRLTLRNCPSYFSFAKFPRTRLLLRRPWCNDSNAGAPRATEIFRDFHDSPPLGASANSRVTLANARLSSLVRESWLVTSFPEARGSKSRVRLQGVTLVRILEPPRFPPYRRHFASSTHARRKSTLVVSLGVAFIHIYAYIHMCTYIYTRVCMCVRAYMYVLPLENCGSVHGGGGGRGRLGVCVCPHVSAIGDGGLYVRRRGCGCAWEVNTRAINRRSRMRRRRRRRRR